MFRYTPLGHSAGSSLARIRPRHILLALGSVTLLVLLLTGSTQHERLSSFAHSLSSPESLPDPSYLPGGLGKFLISKQRKYLSYADWKLYLDGEHGMLDRMMDLDVPMIEVQGDEEKAEAACDGWTSDLGKEDERWETCWRARMWRQIEAFDMPDSFKIWPSVESRNKASLERLQKCLDQPFTLLPDYPEYDGPFEPIQLTSVDDRVEMDTRPCSKTATRVVLGNWWYFTLAYGDPSSNPGETVWLRAQLQVLSELGYTVISTNSYAGMISSHAALPDVISLIWTEDKNTLTCQDDPRCSLFSEFQATNEKYPGTEVREDHTSPVWDEIPEDADKRPPQRWAWTWPELNALPEEERGTIPLWKLFTTTYWGARPNDPFWDFTNQEFTWNPMGQQWTLTPFNYPDHSYIPYSMERDCMKTHYVAESAREDRIFILAKSTEYFNEPFTGIPRDFWVSLGDQTNLTAYSTAEDDENLVREGGHVLGVPEGIESLGRVSKAEFEVQLARSKVMLGLGRPYISPSVYSALCQGTPVVIPYFRGVAVPQGWKLFDGQYSQHGPAAAIGAPYVYSYDYTNMTDMVSKINAAASTPIGRYIPKDMTQAAVERNMDDLMRFNWKRHAKSLQKAQPVQYDRLRRWVVARCFKIGRCEPLKGELALVD
ncbi:hypothetical protein NCC49_000411 [Naganishia albida]|nr:hypothetical protein NCC49_000411 [Naganishia albida]